MTCELWIDIGHGGGDPGKVVDGIAERDELRAVYGPMLSFASQVGVLSLLPGVGNAAARLSYAKTHLPAGSRLLSIHLNGVESRQAHGAEIIVGNDCLADDWAMAEQMLDTYTVWTGICAREVKREGDIVLPDGTRRDLALAYSDDNLVSMILELGFLGNAKDLRRVREHGRHALAATLEIARRWSA